MNITHLGEYNVIYVTAITDNINSFESAEEIAEYISDLKAWHPGKAILVPYLESTPEHIYDAMTELYGRPQTDDRGIWSYWLVKL